MIVQTIFNKYRLTINPDKCKCTIDDESQLVEFMGVNIGSKLSEKQSLAHKLFDIVINEKLRFKKCWTTVLHNQQR